MIKTCIKFLSVFCQTDAIWGAFWNLTQLWALAYPEYYSDYIKSQLLVYSDAGWLGDGIASSKYVSGVGTNFVGLIIAGAYMYGIRDFDIEKGYAASLKNELAYQNRPLGSGKDDVKRFIKYGYVDHIDIDSLNREPIFSGSHTLEYSFSTYAVAQWAKALGKKQDYQQLIGLSKGWEKIFDPKTKLVRPKLKNGKFIDNFNPDQPWRGFQEGNAWQYTFYVPHQPDALVSKIGKTLFASRLDNIFSISQKSIFGGGQTIDAFAGCKDFIIMEISLVCIFLGYLIILINPNLLRNGYEPFVTSFMVTRAFMATDMVKMKTKDSWVHGTFWVQWDCLMCKVGQPKNLQCSFLLHFLIKSRFDSTNSIIKAKPSVF